MRLLAWCKLDIHCLGSLPLHFVSSVNISRKKSEIHESNSRRPFFTNLERSGPDVYNLFIGRVGSCYLSFWRNNEFRVFFAGYVPIWYFTSKLSFFYMARNVADKSFHHHNDGSGVVDAYKTTWIVGGKV